MKTTEFLAKLGPMAREDRKKTKILASLTIAQAILESAWGDSGLTKNANNLFGIKGKYNGQGYLCKTFEYDAKGNRYETTAEFKKYPSWQESVNDHSALFLRLPRYANLIGCTDYRQACENVQADGYATAPNYAGSLIKLIEQYQLYEYDKDVMKMVKAGEFSSSMEAASWQFVLERRGFTSKVAQNGNQWAVNVTGFPEGATAKSLMESLAGLRCYSEIM